MPDGRRNVSHSVQDPALVDATELIKQYSCRLPLKAKGGPAAEWLSLAGDRRHDDPGKYTIHVIW